MTGGDAYSRRQLLAALAGGGVVATAGCMDAIDSDDSRVESTGEAAEFGAPATGLAVRNVSFSAPNYSNEGTVEATVTVQNWGPAERDCWVGFSVVDVAGRTWNEDGTTHEQVVVPGRSTAEVTVTWEAEPAAPTGAYDAVVSLWDRETTDGLEGKLAARTLEAAFTVTAARAGAGTDACPIRGDALYLWGQAATVVTDESATEQLLSTLACLGTEKLFLSWGALPEDIRTDPESPAIGEFAGRCADAGVRVSLLWGAEKGLSGVERASEDIPTMAAHGVDSVHVDLEPESEGELPEFFDDYAALLDDVAVESDVSLFIAPWWVNVATDPAIAVRDHDAVDEIVVAAYRNEEVPCRAQLRAGLAYGPRHPYYAAFEFQSPEVDVVDEEITFWGAGADHAMEVMGAITANPPSADRFRGVALHEYASVTDEHYQ